MENTLIGIHNDSTNRVVFPLFCFLGLYQRWPLLRSWCTLLWTCMSLFMKKKCVFWSYHWLGPYNLSILHPEHHHLLLWLCAFHRSIKLVFFAHSMSTLLTASGDIHLHLDTTNCPRGTTTKNKINLLRPGFPFPFFSLLSICFLKNSTKVIFMQRQDMVLSKENFRIPRPIFSSTAHQDTEV